MTGRRRNHSRMPCTRMRVGHPLGDETVTSDEAEQRTGRGRLRGAAGDRGHDALAVAVEAHRHGDGVGLEDEADGILPAGVVERGDVERLVDGRRAVVSSTSSR